MELMFEKSRRGRKAFYLPKLDVESQPELVPDRFLRKEFQTVELSEVDVVRHFTELSHRNFGVDSGFYPLGSCTMKYNPKVNEDVAGYPGFTDTHPYSPEEFCQGCLRLMYELERYLCGITGMEGFTLQPAAGAHGELTGLLIMRKYFDKKGEHRHKIIIPDSSHGTNPASSSIAGFECVVVQSNKEGEVDTDQLKKIMDEDVAGMMLTNPNTLGLFERNILKIAEIVHSRGGLLYCDGANANANLGIVRMADLGFDIVHLNLHKTFSTPHGCGGPGSGPVGVRTELSGFLPVPRVVRKGRKFGLDYNYPDSIGRIRSFYGNFGVLVKAYAYIRALGSSGLRDVALNSVLNANYLLSKLRKHYHLAYDRRCQHEFVLSDKFLKNNVTTNDLAKRLLDFGFHSPTVYFPLTVHGAIMIEPTETESKETLDKFADAMTRIAQESGSEPETVKNAPHNTPVSRLDTVSAARYPNLRWRPEQKEEH